jgi:hypothetical protein
MTLIARTSEASNFNVILVFLGATEMVFFVMAVARILVQHEFTCRLFQCQYLGALISSFGTCEEKNWLEVLNTWIFGGREPGDKG